MSVSPPPFRVNFSRTARHYDPQAGPFRTILKSYSLYINTQDKRHTGYLCSNRCMMSRTRSRKDTKERCFPGGRVHSLLNENRRKYSAEKRYGEGRGKELVSTLELS